LKLLDDDFSIMSLEYAAGEFSEETEEERDYSAACRAFETRRPGNSSMIDKLAELNRVLFAVKNFADSDGFASVKGSYRTLQKHGDRSSNSKPRHQHFLR